MPTISEPQIANLSVECWQARLAEYNRQFADGEVSETVYTANLFGLGYRGQEIRREVLENWTKRSRK